MRKLVSDLPLLPKSVDMLISLANPSIGYNEITKNKLKKKQNVVATCSCKILLSAIRQSFELPKVFCNSIN